MSKRPEIQRYRPPKERIENDDKDTKPDRIIHAWEVKERVVHAWELKKDQKAVNPKRNFNRTARKKSPAKRDATLPTDKPNKDEAKAPKFRLKLKKPMEKVTKKESPTKLTPTLDSMWLEQEIDMSKDWSEL